MPETFDQSARALNALLLYASDKTRLAWAESFASVPDPDLLDLLVATARSDESWVLRARCLEVLGHVAVRTSQPMAEGILAALSSERA